MSCRGSPVPLCKSAGTKQLKVVHGASATCVLQNVDSGLLEVTVIEHQYQDSLRVWEDGVLIGERLGLLISI